MGRACPTPKPPQVPILKKTTKLSPNNTKTSEGGSKFKRGLNRNEVCSIYFLKIEKSKNKRSEGTNMS